MGIKSHQMDVETPAGGKDKSEDFIRERRERFTRGSLAGLEPGGLFHFHHDVGLRRHMTSPRSPMTSSNILGGFGGSYVPSDTCGGILRPKKA
jgi:hypothetical protein